MLTHREENRHGVPVHGSASLVGAQNLQTLVSFAYTNGSYPYAALTLGNDGNFYGTTYGAVVGSGTVFRVTTNGALTTLVFFDNTNGANPQASLTPGNDGNFYGTTASGGNLNLNSGEGYGTVFKMTTNGTLTTLVSFASTNGCVSVCGTDAGQ